MKSKLTVVIAAMSKQQRYDHFQIFHIIFHILYNIAAPQFFDFCFDFYKAPPFEKLRIH